MGFGLSFLSLFSLSLSLFATFVAANTRAALPPRIRPFWSVKPSLWNEKTGSNVYHRLPLKDFNFSEFDQYIPCRCNFAASVLNSGWNIFADVNVQFGWALFLDVNVELFLDGRDVLERDWIASVVNHPIHISESIQIRA